MPVRHVERLEVVVIGLDFRSLRELKTHAPQDLDALVDRLRDGVQCADGGRSSRQRDVDPLPLERLGQFALADRALALGECLLEGALDQVCGATNLAALVRGQLAQPAEQVGQRALPSQVRDAPLLEGRGVDRSIELGEGDRLQLVEASRPVRSWARVCVCHGGSLF